MTHSSNKPHSDPPQPSQGPSDQQEFGYGKPPKHSQFRKGQSGNPAGRPKAPIGVSIKEILDGDQRGKNGEVISGREAYVIALVNGALSGNQKAFSKFMTLMKQSGLIRHETTTNPSVVYVPFHNQTKEDYIRNFGRPLSETTQKKDDR